MIFIGREPRLLGKLDDAPSAEAVRSEVDAMLIANRLSAERISRAMLAGKLFIVAYG